MDNNDNDNKKTWNKRHKIINEIKTGKRIMLKILTNQCPGGEKGVFVCGGGGGGWGGRGWRNL